MKKIILLIFVIANYLFALDAKMEIIKKKINLPTIVVSISKDSNDKQLALQVQDLIEKDLQVSGHFKIIKQDNNAHLKQTPNAYQLKKQGIDLFLDLYIKYVKTGSLIAKFKLYDINNNKMVLNKIYSIASYEQYPFLAHKIAIVTNQYLNAPTIKWMDKFIIFSRYKNARESEIVVSDYTLTYQKVLVSGGLNIFPKWADKNQESFYYTTYINKTPVLKRRNLYTNKSYEIARSDGMIVCSDISFNDSKIILTMAPNSQPDIYIYDLKSRIKTRITKYKGIDVGGSFVENDKKIVFVSDRLKKPNIFVKIVGQKGVERLVYHGKNNSQCTTFDNYIVYTSRESDNEFTRNAFNLYLISTDSDFIRRLTTTGRNQFPKFSSDGDSVLFIKNYKGKSYLGIIRLNYNKSFLFPLKSGKLQSIDW